jgi:hypothetical protein
MMNCSKTEIRLKPQNGKIPLARDGEGKGHKDWEKTIDQPLQKRWVCGVAEEDNDRLGSSNGPHTNDLWTQKYTRLCIKALIFYGYK